MGLQFLPPHKVSSSKLKTKSGISRASSFQAFTWLLYHTTFHRTFINELLYPVFHHSFYQEFGLETICYLFLVRSLQSNITEIMDLRYISTASTYGLQFAFQPLRSNRASQYSKALIRSMIFERSILSQT